MKTNENNMKTNFKQCEIYMKSNENQCILHENVMKYNEIESN